MKGYRPWLLVGAGLAGACNVHPTNRTPTDQPTLTRVDYYPLSVEVSAEPLVLRSTIRVTALVGGAEYPLQGFGEGFWTVDYPAACTPPTVDYRFRTNWKWLALLVPLSRSRTDPETGVFTATRRLPPAVEAPDEVYFYGDAANGSITRQIPITNRRAEPLTVLSATIGAASPCGFGDCTGRPFRIVDPPVFPLDVACGANTTVAVSFGSTVQSSGTLNVITSAGTEVIQLSGKLFIF